MRFFGIVFHYLSPLPEITLSSLLNTCAENLENSRDHKKSVIFQPSRDGVEYLNLVRRITDWNKAIYGTPLYEITALVSDIFFPELNITEKKVMNALKKHHFSPPNSIDYYRLFSGD